MSQTLALIVAAMVLMMTALSLIFMTQDSLQGLFGDSQDQSCISTVNTRCSIEGSGAEFSAPASCDGFSGDLGEHSISDGTITCSD
mgnify:CR=1 FL=1